MEENRIENPDIPAIANPEGFDLKKQAYEDSKGFMRKLNQDHPDLGKNLVGTALVGLGGTVVYAGFMVLTA